MQGKMPILENHWFDLVFSLKGQAPKAGGGIYYDFASFFRLFKHKRTLEFYMILTSNPQQ